MYLTWLNSTKQAQGFEESQGEMESSSAIGSGPVLRLMLRHCKILVPIVLHFRLIRV